MSCSDDEYASKVEGRGRGLYVRKGLGLRSYTPEYSTGIMDKSQRMRHRRKR